MTNSIVSKNLIKSLIKIKADELLKKLSLLNMKICVIESMTGGDIINTLTNIPGYSENIYGGLIVYHNDAKNELLGGIKTSVYTLEYAKKMCTDATKYSANIFVSVTGNANPTNPLNEDYSAVFYTAFALKDSTGMKIIGKKIILDDQILNNYKENNMARRKLIKKMATKKVLNFVNDSIDSFIFKN